MAVLVGLTGGMGSGKTTVANLLRKLGAHVVDADILARMLVEPGKEAWQEIVNLFGTSVLNADETLDRRKIADIVFMEPGKKKALETILHPRVMEEEQKNYQEIAGKDPQAIVVVDAALLIESGNYRQMDKVVVVECDEKTQIERVAARGKFSRDDIQRRLSQQMPLPEKLKYADFVVHNNSGLPELEEEVKHLFRQLQAEVS